MACSLRMRMDAIERLAAVSGGVSAPPGGGLGVDHRHPIARLALEPPILRATTAPWEGIACQISQAFILRLPCLGRTHDAKVTGLLAHAAVFDRVAFLLATGVCRLVRWSGGPMHRAFSTLMPTRGGPGRALRPCGREQSDSTVGCTGGKPLWLCSGIMPHGMKKMHPLVRVRVGPPHEWSV
jgi:hypothetical protein